VQENVGGHCVQYENDQACREQSSNFRRANTFVQRIRFLYVILGGAAGKVEYH